MKKIYLTALVLCTMTGAMAQTPLISTPEPTSVMETTLMPLHAASTTVEAKALAANEMYVGYCLEPTNVFRLTVDTYDIATYLDNMIVGKYVGDKVTKIRAFIGSKPKAMTLWLRERLTEEPVFSQEIAAEDLPENEWIEVELPADKAYTIKEKGYYIGYTITQKKINADDKKYNPLTISTNGTLLKNTVLISDNGGKNWVDYTTAFGQNVVAVLGMQSAIASDKHAEYDLSVSNFHGDISFIRREPGSDKATVGINGYIFNAGTKPITSFDMTISGEGIESATSPMEIKGGLSQFRGAVLRASVDIPTNVPSVKIHLKASNMNKGSNTDGYAGNDELDTEDICIFEQDTVKTSLVEMYTTAKCPNCPYGHKVIEALPEDCNKVLVAHHVGYGEDIYTMNESNEYLYEFGVYGAPYATADRAYIQDVYAVAFGLGYTNPKQGAIEVNKSITFAQSALPAFASIRIASDYDKDTRELTVKVSGRKINAELFDKAMKQPRVNVFLTEDGLVSNQSGGGQNYTHDHVLRAILGDIWGKEVTWNGDVYTAEFKTTIDSDWEADNMNIVAFLTDEDYDSRYYHYSMNAAQVKLGGNTTAIETNAFDGLRIDVANGTINVAGDYKTFSVYNMQGVEVENSNLVSGIYLVKVQTNKQVVVLKTIVD